MNGKPLAYLDSAASAQKPQAVIDAMRAAMETQYANVHRGVYQLSQATTTAFEAVRGKVAPIDDELVEALAHAETSGEDVLFDLIDGELCEVETVEG